MTLWHYYDLKQDFYFLLAALYAFNHEGRDVWIVVSVAIIAILMINYQKYLWSKENDDLHHVY